MTGYHLGVYRALVIGLAAVIACATATREGPGSDGNGNGDGGKKDGGYMDANNCATQPCDIPTQCGCGSGACDIDGSDLMGTACRMVTTPGHETSACVGPADCDRGYVCLGGATDASCHKYCGSNGDCMGPRGQCLIDITTSSGAIPGIPPACSSSCDPANNAAGGCPSTLKCSIFTVTHAGSDHDISDCAGMGTGSQGATGSGTNCKVGSNGDDTLCAANHLCTTVDANNTYFNCRRICTLNPAGGQCTGGRTCLGFSTALIIGGTTYGVCN